MAIQIDTRYQHMHTQMVRLPIEIEFVLNNIIRIPYTHFLFGFHPFCCPCPKLQPFNESTTIFIWSMIWKRYHNRFIVEQTSLLNKQIKVEHIVPMLRRTPSLSPFKPTTHIRFSYWVKNLHVSLVIIPAYRLLTININTIGLICHE